jgi:hypothetical protein
VFGARSQALGDVVATGLVIAQAGDRDAVEGRVGFPVTSAGQSMVFVFPTRCVQGCDPDQTSESCFAVQALGAISHAGQ